MKYSLIFFISFILSAGINAADDKTKEIELPEIFISGDAAIGAELVDSCAACHGADGNSISTDWPKLSGQNQRYLYSAANLIVLAQARVRMHKNTQKKHIFIAINYL